MKQGWHIKELASGEFAVQRWDAGRGKVVRWGVYTTRQLAADVCQAVRREEKH